MIAVLTAMLIVAALTAPAATAALLVTAENDDYAADRDQLLSVSAAAGVLDNDTGVGLTAAKITNPAHGTLTLNGNGSFTYRPTSGYTGSDTFTYEAQVLNLLGIVLLRDRAVVTITVSAPAPTPTPTAAPTPTPAPTATPTPTASPTPVPTPTPTPRPTATPVIPLPTLPLPTLPLPTIPLPTLPVPTSTPRITPTPTPRATASPTASPTTPGQPSPGVTTAPISTPGSGASGPPGSGTNPTAAPTSDATDAAGVGGAGTGGTGTGGTGTGVGAAPGDRLVVPPIEPPGIDIVSDATFNGFAAIEWAVPAFALVVPSLLLMLAIGAQALVGVMWLPFVRRWLGGVGVRRRQPSGSIAR